MKEDIWITGVGVLTPFGATLDGFADAILAGRSAISAVSAFDVTQHPSQIAATIGEVPCPNGFDADEFARRPRTEQAALMCCVSALADAGLSTRKSGAEARFGLVLGGGGEWLPAWEDDFRRSPRGSLVDRPEEPIRSTVAALRADLGLSGPAVTLSTACASGNHALWLAREWLRQGIVDVCLAGASDLNATPLTLAAFGNLRALSRRNAEPGKASRPFDKARDGFVLGEGAAMFVLQRARDVARPSGRAHAVLAGVGCTSDAFHMVAPCPEAGQAAEAIRRALRDAGLSPDEVDYVNAHGTGTTAGDLAECLALRQAFGSAVERVPVSSTKSMTGHCLTAASAVEAVACLVALARQTIPPTVNLDEPDPACAVRHVPREAESARLRWVLSNAFGFGGSNSCVVFGRVEGDPIR